MSRQLSLWRPYRGLEGILAQLLCVEENSMEKDYNCDECKDGELTEECQQCCDHEWDADEGGMCINCGREDYYNFIGD